MAGAYSSYFDPAVSTGAAVGRKYNQSSRAAAGPVCAPGLVLGNDARSPVILTALSGGDATCRAYAGPGFFCLGEYPSQPCAADGMERGFHRKAR